jgi:putative phosphoribosyl transferase
VQSLPGNLLVPSQANGVVVLAQGCGSRRQRGFNPYAADVLLHLHIATLLLDLLTEREMMDDVEDDDCDVGLMTQRLEQVLDWLRGRPDLAGLRVGLLGTSSGTAAALRTAAVNPGRVAAIVSRAGRPDLAAPYLERVEAPTLLLVGGADAELGQYNRCAMSQLRCNKRLEIVPGATLRQDEPAAVETVAHVAGNWFMTHLSHKRLS